MDRDLISRTMTGLIYGALLLSAVACQQSEPSEVQGDVSVAPPAIRLAPVETGDADVLAAQKALAEGRAGIASTIAMPVLRTPERRTPEALLVASRAAAEWGGWQLVHAMLAHETWLNSRFGGEGLELLARAAMERGTATEARDHAEAALRVPTDQTSRGIRLVLLARSLDRLDQRDTAAATYRRAAEALPLVRDWLMLRAAGSISDAGRRQDIYEDIDVEPAKARVAHTEAQTLERFGLALAAANAYEKIGDLPSSYRLRLASDGDAARRSSVRAGLLGYIQRDARGGDLERAIEVLDAAFPSLDQTSQLLVARRAADAGLASRAAAGFARVPAAALTDADVISWARALVSSGRSADAAARIAARRLGAALQAEGSYVRGWALVRAGRSTQARPILQRVVTSHRNTRFAADALYLLADLESDAGRDTRARDLHAQACLSQPAGSYSDNACFRSGLLSYILGDARRASSAFDELRTRFPNSGEVLAATYWSGRAQQRLGNAAAARERWSEIVAKEPLSYYSSLSAKRLGQTRELPAASGPIAKERFQGAANRAALLEYLGMTVEERYEHEAIEATSDSSAATLLAAGATLLERGEVSRAIRVGWRAVAADRSDSRAYMLIYPILRDSQLIARSKATNLDPALVAGVIRQESSWNPRAVSRAGARGLMQVMPVVGEAIARSKRYPLWDPALLFDADVNLDLGTSHLRAGLSQYRGNLPRALAAYNAGGSRVTRWSRRAGVSDPEMFVERIPFVETRDYVRIVTRNAELYRALYDLD